MSILSLKSFFAMKTGRDVLPENLPLGVLILLARQLAFLADGTLEHAEIHQLKGCMCDLVERLLGMQSVSRLRIFRENIDEILPGLTTEIDRTIRNEIVNRLIDRNTRTAGLEEAFTEHFLDKSAST